MGERRCVHVHPFDIETNNGDMSPFERANAIRFAERSLRCTRGAGHRGLHRTTGGQEFKTEPAIYFTTHPSRHA